MEKWIQDDIDAAAALHAHWAEGECGEIMDKICQAVLECYAPRRGNC